MILAGTEIEHEVWDGNITIEPFERSHLNPASLDLTLGRGVSIYPHRDVIDPKCPPEVCKMEIPDEGFVVRPGFGYLMHTVERITTDKYVPVLDGKSSIGRLFVSVHQTAGYGDPGFNGQYTLEVTALFPVRLYAGMRICQIRFHCMKGTPVSYRDVGHYVGDKAIGAVPSEARSTAFNGK